MNDYFNASGNPSTRAQGSSAVMRAEFLSVEEAFDKLPDLSSSAGMVPYINAGGTAWTSSSSMTFDGTTLSVPAITVSGAVSVLDSNFSIKDNADATKIAKFECSGITTATTRTFTLPDASTTLVGTDTTQTLSSKSLTSPIVTGSPTAAGATWADLGAATTIDINGGTIDGTTIGSSSATTIKGTVVTATTRVDSGAAGDLTLATNAGTAQALIKHVASATRTVNISGSNGSNPSISASAGNLAIGSGWTAAGQTCADLGTVTTASIGTLTITTRIDSGGATNISLTTNGGTSAALQVNHIASSSRAVTVTGGDGSTSPSISTTGGNLRLTSSSGSVVIGNTSANLIFATDNSNDFGAAGANRPRTGYFGTSVLTPTLDSGSAGNLSIKTNTGTSQVVIVHNGSATRTVNLSGSSTNPSIAASAGNLAITSGWTANGQTCADLGTVTTGAAPASIITSGTMATARLGSGTADTRSFLRGDQSYALSWNLIAKSANQSKTSDTSRAADSELVLSVAANKTYIIRLVLFIDYGAGGLKYRITGPATPTSVKFLGNAIVNNAPTTQIPSYTEAYPVADTSITSGTSIAIVLEAILQNGANAGTFAFEWAQNSSNVAATTVLKGSYLMYSQVDA